MSGLVEFLQARITDTIAVAREIQAQAVTDGLAPDDPRSPALRLARMTIADCEAKRQIVKQLETTHDLHISAEAELILLTLIEPYSDHPEYREEW